MVASLCLGSWVYFVGGKGELAKLRSHEYLLFAQIQKSLFNSRFGRFTLPVPNLELRLIPAPRSPLSYICANKRYSIFPHVMALWTFIFLRYFLKSIGKGDRLR